MFSPPGRGAAVVSTPGGIGAACVAPAPAIAVTFRFAVVDLTDTTPGQDLWEYSYQVTGLTLTAGQGFTIFFDLNRYTLLQNPPPFVNADFDLLIAQPDLALSSNGFYDALALRNNPSFADLFKLTSIRILVPQHQLITGIGQFIFRRQIGNKLRQRDLLKCVDAQNL